MSHAQVSLPPPFSPSSASPAILASGLNLLWLQVVDKSRYAAGDNSLEREIQVLCKVCDKQLLTSLPVGQISSSKCIPSLQVDHPNCIKLYAVYITGRKVYIVTELVTGGELLDRCDPGYAPCLLLASCTFSPC